MHMFMSRSLGMVDTAFEDSGPSPVLDLYLTAKDRAQLTDLGPHQVQQWTMEQIDKLTSRISLQSVHNAAAPINHILSTDAMMAVFSHLEPSLEHRMQLNVFQVCRLWRNLLVRSPAFCAKMLSSFRHPSRYAPDGLVLFRSLVGLTHSLPLTLNVDPLNSELLVTLKSLAPRVASLTITTPVEDRPSVYAVLLRQSMPLLEHLAVFHAKGRFTDDLTDNLKFVLNRRLHPRLRAIHHPVTLLDISSFDKDIRELCLHKCPCPFCQLAASQQPVSLSSLTEALERCHGSLEVLDLDSITPPRLELRTADD